MQPTIYILGRYDQKGVPSERGDQTEHLLDGSAYVIGGFGMTALGSGNIIVVPIRSGIGLRLGANIGYLKFTPQATWNPF